MKGILLVSHGSMAEGVLDTVSIFFGEQMQQIDFLSLQMSDDPEIFKEKLQKKISEIDNGDGVLIFADLYGGTPSNIATSLLLADRASEALTIISGLNLPMVMEAMTMRNSEVVDDSQIVEIGKSGICSVNEIVKKRNKR